MKEDESLLRLKNKAEKEVKTKYIKITPTLHSVLVNRGVSKNTIEDNIWELLLAVKDGN